MSFSETNYKHQVIVFKIGEDHIEELKTIEIPVSAMDALERLHNQGRKVGVIFHVQEMTERIPVQIMVCKQQGGRSKVEVVGYYKEHSL